MNKLLTILVTLSISPATAVPIEDPHRCPGGDRAVTSPASVEIEKVVEGVKRLLPALSPAAEGEIRRIFDTAKVKTKMEQFYSLLYSISQNIPAETGSTVNLEPLLVRNLLLQSKVFRTPDLPDRIRGVTIERYDPSEPKYIVRFDGPRIRLPLNDGAGFNLYRNGLCQQAKELIFGNLFSFKLKRLRNGNLEARHFQGVDLFGDFGNRGIIDVDLNYVELRSVEFYRGTQDGKVTAYVSEEEFRKNDHNLLLRIVTKFVPDRSVQPIDW